MRQYLFNLIEFRINRLNVDRICNYNNRVDKNKLYPIYIQPKKTQTINIYSALDYEKHHKL